MPVMRSFLILLASTSFIRAADWPQWRGPNRAAVVPDFTAPAAWPKELQKKWSTPVGDGVATPASGRRQTLRLRIPERQGGHPLSGRRAPARNSGRTTTRHGRRADRGKLPRRPVVAGRCRGQSGHIRGAGHAFLPGCDKGTVIWRKDSTGGIPGFSTASSPLLVDGLCVVQVGGERGNGSVVAYDLADGKEKWKWSSDGTKYRLAHALLTLNDLKAIVVETAGTISAVSLADGKLLWSTDFSTRYNASTPMVEGAGHLLRRFGPTDQAVKLEKQGDKVAGKELWSTRETSVIYNSPVVKDGLMFGLSERNEVFCIDTKSGKKLWSQRLESGGGGGGGRGRGRGGYGSIVAAGSGTVRAHAGRSTGGLQARPRRVQGRRQLQGGGREHLRLPGRDQRRRLYQGPRFRNLLDVRVARYPECYACARTTGSRHGGVVQATTPSANTC